MMLPAYLLRICQTHFGILECSVTDSRATEAVVTQCLPAKLQAYETFIGKLILRLSELLTTQESETAAVRKLNTMMWEMYINLLSTVIDQCITALAFWGFYPFSV